MDRTYWHKQTASIPLFSELLWSRPENRYAAGKLLIIGGNAYGFAEPAAAYVAAERAGVGVVRILLPASLRRTVGNIIDNVEYAPSTPSGSFAKSALANFLDQAEWADGVLLAGNLGRNSETAILLEEFLNKFSGALMMVGDSADYFLSTNDLSLLERPNTVLTLEFNQLQQLFRARGQKEPVTSTMGLLKLVESLHLITEQYIANIIVRYEETILAAAAGQVSTTNSNQALLQIAASAIVWWLQYPKKTFEALSTAIIYSDTGGQGGT